MIHGKNFRGLLTRIAVFQCNHISLFLRLLIIPLLILVKKYNSSIEEERHVTGQELSEGIKQFAMEKFGYMTRIVLEQWGITKSGDFGEIVFNLVDSGLMGKTETDTLEDFKDLYDFYSEFDEKFKLEGDFDFSHSWDLFENN